MPAQFRGQTAELPGLLANFQLIADACEQFALVKRLRQIVICSRFEALNTRVRPCPRRQEDHGKMLELVIRSNRGQEIPSAHIGHHLVCQDEIWSPLSNLLETGAPVRCQKNVVSWKEKVPYIAAQIGIVLRIQDGRTVMVDALVGFLVQPIHAFDVGGTFGHELGHYEALWIVILIVFEIYDAGGREVRGSDGERDMERGTFAVPAENGDGASMKIHNLFGEG